MQQMLFGASLYCSGHRSLLLSEEAGRSGRRHWARGFRKEESVEMVVAVGALCLQAGGLRVLSPRPMHCRAAAWPWVDPSVDFVQKPRQSLEHPRKLHPTNLLRRRPSDGQQRPDEEGDKLKAWLPGAPVVERPRAVHNAAALAYMGDAIFELYVRRHFLTPPQPMDKYNQQVMGLVCCEAQHALLEKLLKQDVFSEEERDVLRWGRNVDAGNKGARRRAGGIVYSSASSLETLLGYLYLKNVARLEEVMYHMGFNAEKTAVKDLQ